MHFLEHWGGVCVDVDEVVLKNRGMANQAIEIENLTKEYPYGFLNLKKRLSLEGLTLQVEMGEVFGFLGPNGAGKSTTIKCLMRLIFPTKGTARILGKSIEDVSMHRDIGYLPEQPYFYDYLTAGGSAGLFCPVPPHDRERSQRKCPEDAKKSGTGERKEDSAPEIFEGDVAARRIGAGHFARAESCGA